MTPGGWDVYGHLWWHTFILDALPVVLPVAVLITGWLLYGALNQWRDARALAVAPMPASPGNPDCERCSDRDILARCTCPVTCPGRPFDCVGDHTSMAVLTAADMRMLHKWIREGQE